MMTALSDETTLRVAPALTMTSRGPTTYLRCGGRVLRYDGGATRILPLLLPLLDGRRRLDEVVDRLGGGGLRPAVLRLCGQLLTDGLLVDEPTHDTDAPSPPPLEKMLQRTSTWAPRRCRLSTVQVAGQVDEVDAVTRVAPGRWSVRAVALDELLDQPAADGVATIVWVDDPNDDTLAEWNASAYHNRHLWIPISHFDGEVAVVGPFVRPRETPCFECYRRRRAARNRLGEQYLRMRPVAPDPLTATALTVVLAGIAVTLLDDWSARANPYLPGAVRTVTFDEGLRVGAEYVLRVPRCPACRPTANVARSTLWSEQFPPEDLA